MPGFKTDTTLITNLNLVGVIVAYAMLALSLYMAEVPLATKGYWAIGVLLLSLALVNFVRYRFEALINDDRLRQIEDAKTEKMLQDYVSKEEG